MSGRRSWLALVLVAMLTVSALMAGCSKPPKLVVMSLGNRFVAALSADDTVRLMQRSGFTDAEIVEHGPALRNAIAATGAAKIVKGDDAAAMFAVDGNLVHGVSRQRGSFVYDMKAGQFRR